MLSTLWPHCGNYSLTEPLSAGNSKWKYQYNSTKQMYWISVHKQDHIDGYQGRVVAVFLARPTAINIVYINVIMTGCYTAVLWQKEAALDNDISRKWAKCVCYVHWHQCNIIMSWLKYLSAGWVFLLQTWNGSRINYAKSNLKTSLSQILAICQLLPFVRVGQYIGVHFIIHVV